MQAALKKVKLTVDDKQAPVFYSALGSRIFFLAMYRCYICNTYYEHWNAGRCTEDSKGLRANNGWYRPSAPTFHCLPFFFSIFNLELVSISVSWFI